MTIKPTRWLADWRAKRKIKKELNRRPCPRLTDAGEGGRVSVADLIQLGVLEPKATLQIQIDQEGSQSEQTTPEPQGKDSPEGDSV